jgi:hypothetical protein
VGKGACARAASLDSHHESAGEPDEEDFRHADSG